MKLIKESKLFRKEHLEKIIHQTLRLVRTLRLMLVIQIINIMLHIKYCVVRNFQVGFL